MHIISRSRWPQAATLASLTDLKLMKQRIHTVPSSSLSDVTIQYMKCFVFDPIPGFLMIVQSIRTGQPGNQATIYFAWYVGDLEQAMNQPQTL